MCHVDLCSSSGMTLAQRGMLRGFLERHGVPITSTEDNTGNSPQAVACYARSISTSPDVDHGSPSKRIRHSSSQGSHQSDQHNFSPIPFHEVTQPGTKSMTNQFALLHSSDLVFPESPAPALEHPSSGQEPIVERRSERRRKRYFRPDPSRFCHICYRTNKLVRHVICSNINEGYCRKVICEKCIETYGETYQWNVEEIFNDSSKFLCSHCRNSCPETAQCASYNKSNRRRSIARAFDGYS